MSAGIQNVIVDQGADWRRDLTLTDKYDDACDLSGYTAASAYCGQTYNDANAIEISASFIDGDNEETVNGDDTGKIRLELTDAQTSAISWTRGYYDVYLTEPSGDRVRILQGQMMVRPKVPATAA